MGLQALGQSLFVACSLFVPCKLDDMGLQASRYGTMRLSYGFVLWYYQFEYGFAVEGI